MRWSQWQRVVSVAVAVACWWPVLAGAKDLKLACVDMEKVFQGYYKTKIADRDMKRESERVRTNVTDQEKVLRELEKKYTEAKAAADNPALSDAAKKDKEKERDALKSQLQGNLKVLRDYSEGKMRDMKERYEKSRGLLLKEITAVVTDFGTTGQYDLVLDISGMTSNRISSFVYYRAELDVTDALIARLNKGHEAEIPPDEAPAAEPAKEPAKDAPAAPAPAPAKEASPKK